MAMNWFRVDTGIGTHDKILELTEDPQATPANRYRAAFSYVAAIGWAVDQETDGRIPQAALKLIHGTPTTAKLLVAHRLWEPTAGGWQIRNFATRQPTGATSAERSDAARKAAHARWGKRTPS